ncbi:hypothetical protein [Microbulbifer mangrovi]|uniref:hypothetical protein n=1 Tax=Microbulbifer mangrovi TaxID=927787 RepID=UPI000990635D|nr:hypothetical protein [Microbulbifer mangrovi]
MSLKYRLRQWFSVEDAAGYLSFKSNEQISIKDIAGLIIEQQLRVHLRLQSHHCLFKSEYLDAPYNQRATQNDTDSSPNTAMKFRLPPKDLIVSDPPNNLPIEHKEIESGGRTIRVKVQRKTTSRREVACPVINFDDSPVKRLFSAIYYDSQVPASTGRIEVMFQDQPYALIEFLSGLDFPPLDKDHDLESDSDSALDPELSRTVQDFLEDILFPQSWRYDTNISLSDIALKREDLDNLFVQSSSTGTPGYWGDGLVVLVRAAKEFWGNADPSEKDTFPKSADVEAWLKKEGLSDRAAKSAPQLLRPFWANQKK